MQGKNFPEYEWMLTNSLGAYALGAPALINRRKYHGLLIASDQTFTRRHLVSSIEETLEGEGFSFSLDSCGYTGIVHPDGWKNISEYFTAPAPCWVYSEKSGRGRGVIVKTIKMHPAINAAAVKYRNAGSSRVRMTLRPRFTMRDHHSVNPPGFWDGAGHEASVSGSSGKFTANGLSAHVFAPAGKVAEEFIIYRDVSYIMEILRGYDSAEDLASPFKITFELAPREEAYLLFSDESAGENDFAEIEKRYSAHPFPSGHPEAPENESAKCPRPVKSFGYAGYISTLEQSFLDFIANDDLVAGFPWFSAWGRDTMISLEAFKYFPGLGDLQKKILFKYGAAMRNGVIPNTTGEGGSGANFDTVDASLWFGIRAMEFIDSLEEADKIRLGGYMKEIITGYLDSPELPFYTDPEDGLISLHPETNLGLTWMDAKVHGVPVTPRYGKPVEINCLWYNLLKMYSAKNPDSPLGKRVERILKKNSASLKKFFDGEVFIDRVSPEGVPVREIRPNYIIGLSLPFSVFSKDEIAAGYSAARERLLTPCGLRSLSPESPAFRGKYMGSQPMRDLAYHQGTVWVCLLLPMAKTAAKIYGGEKLVKELERMIYFFRRRHMEGEMSRIPEIYDGVNPSSPKGAPAQCWSAAAVLIIEKMIREKS